MQARRAARELAFILFSQFDKTITNYSKENLDDIIIKSVRILSSSASDDLKISLGALVDMKNKIDDYDAVISTTIVPDSIKDKVIQGLPLLNGMGVDQVYDQLKTRLGL